MDTDDVDMVVEATAVATHAATVEPKAKRKRAAPAQAPPEGVVLEEVDVPGAYMASEDPHNENCEALRRWLRCRGLSMTGNKEELVQRCGICFRFLVLLSYF
jgi:hypothetical protein